MAIEADIYARSQAVAGLAALVGTRFYPHRAPQNTALPYCVYSLIDSNTTHAMQSDTGLIESRWEVSCYAATDASAIAVGEHVRTAFSRYSGTPSSTLIETILLDGEDGSYDHDANLHVRDINLIIWYQEAA